MIGQDRQRIPAFPVLQQVHVIQHQHHRHGHRGERRPQPRHDRAGHRSWPARPARRTPARPTGCTAIQRCRHVAEQDLRVVVPLVDRHPGERPAVTRGPLRQQRRLPVPRRRDDRDDRSGVLPRQAVDQGRPGDRPGPDQGTAELRWRRGRTPARRALRRDGPLAHAAVLHSRNASLQTFCPFYALARQLSRQEKWARVAAGLRVHQSLWVIGLSPRDSAGGRTGRPDWACPDALRKRGRGSPGMGDARGGPAAHHHSIGAHRTRRQSA